MYFSRIIFSKVLKYKFDPKTSELHFFAKYGIVFNEVNSY